MKLMKLPFVGHGTAAGSLFIHCCKCGEKKRYSEASAAGWCADLAGKPYADYVCEKCQACESDKLDEHGKD